jgi:hypothetical protein
MKHFYSPFNQMKENLIQHKEIEIICYVQVIILHLEVASILYSN